MENYQPVAASPPPCTYCFAANIFEKIAVGNDENVIISPVSIHTCLGLVFFGTEGITAREMRKALKLGIGQPEEIAKNFEQFVQTSFKSSRNDDDVQLRMANRIYVNDDLWISPRFNEIARRAFQSKAEQVDFADSECTVAKINTFVEKQTHCKIKDFLESGSIDENTSIVLVNAIYFKGTWETPFSIDATYKSDFAVLGKDNVEVDTMHMEEQAQYGEFLALDAKVLELPYKNSSLSMLFLLPNKVDGLKDMEKKLACKNLNEVVAKLESYPVAISIPKFCIEYDLDLKGPLQKLGLETIFTEQAEFGGLLINPAKQKVSEMKHKAYIDVNEAGSEAAAASFVKLALVSMEEDQKTFNADHPFAFAIRDSNAVYFYGHVVKLFPELENSEEEWETDEDDQN